MNLLFILFDSHVMVWLILILYMFCADIICSNQGPTIIGSILTSNLSLNSFSHLNELIRGLIFSNVQLPGYAQLQTYIPGKSTCESLNSFGRPTEQAADRAANRSANRPARWLKFKIWWFGWLGDLHMLNTNVFKWLLHLQRLRAWMIL